MRHVYEVLQLWSVMEHDDRYEQAAIEEKAKEGIRNMNNVIDRYIKEGEARGEARGVIIGAEKKEAEVNERVATDMLKEKLPLKTITKISKLSEERIRQIAKSIGVAVL